MCRALRRVWPDWSCGRGWQHEGQIIAQRRDGLQGQVASPLDNPFVPLGENGADEVRDGVLFAEDADDFGATLDLAVEVLQRVVNRYEVDLSRFCAAPSARLGHLAFEGQGAFASQC